MNEICTLPHAVLHPGFRAYQIPVAVEKPRSVLSTGPVNFLALERDTQSVIHVFDSNDDGIPESRRPVASAKNLNHGLAIYEGYIYASSDTMVYRWPYQDFTADAVGEVEEVVFNINADGRGGAPKGHTTRTLVFDDAGRLYISVGSFRNVDADSHRSRIRRFDLNNAILPLDFQNGEVFADGLRNEVGLAFDKHGILWGVENGADRLARSDLGGDIHNDNPAEELNRFREEDAGKHWGYPYCWTEYSLPEGIGQGRGTAWVWPSFLNEFSDEECRAQYEPAVVSMQAHSAPLGITFYDWKPEEELPSECNGTSPFPQYMDGHAFIAHHGSWNRDVPTGYKVVRIAFDGNGEAISGEIDFLAHEPPDAQWPDGFRPVDVTFDDCGRLIVSSDGTRGSGSKFVRIEYIGNMTMSESNKINVQCDAYESLGSKTGHTSVFLFAVSTALLIWMLRP